MKIASDYYEKGLGKSLGFLVGALVFGTALPHFLKGIEFSATWQFVIFTTTILAIIGGTLIMLFVKDGPYRKPAVQIELSAFFKVFKNSKFRSAAFGYFGHMWELYSFWTFVPILLLTYNSLHPEQSLDVSMCAFVIIAVGGISCFASGYIAEIIGTKQTAFYALLLSCICCLISPFIFQVPSSKLFLVFLIFWGIVVIADSPMFSTLVAQNADSKIKGTALTIVNCIGFALTIVSIQVLSYVDPITDSNNFYALLAIGPILGLWALAKKD